MWQIKGDVLPSIYSSFLKKCKLGVVIINQLVLPFSGKRPVTCYIITQSRLVPKINSSFSSCFMIFEFLFLKTNFSSRKGAEYSGFCKNKKKKKENRLSSFVFSVGTTGTFPFSSSLTTTFFFFKLLLFSHKSKQAEISEAVVRAEQAKHST